MPPALPHRILFLRPDAYGDLFLFEPVLRLVRHTWPHAEVAVLIRHTYADAVPLIACEGVRWLTTDCHPYREGPAENPTALNSLREVVQAFAPDCVVAACSEQTWLEPVVAAFLPNVRQIALGNGLTDPLIRAALDAVVPVDWSAIYPEKVLVDPELREWEKNLRVADTLLDGEVPRWWPVASVPESARQQASQILAELGLPKGEFVACAAAGTANVPIKVWPATHYGEMLAWLERERGIRGLLIGHVTEREHLEAVRATARQRGTELALWLGQDGEMPVVAGLLAEARFYFGNDTGTLHLAASLDRPVVSIFGGGHWPRFAPLARRALTIVQSLSCFGCGWDCYFADAPCVQTISLHTVQQALEQFLQSDADGMAIYEAEGLDTEARALIDAATPRLRFQREDSTNRLRQVQQLTLLARSLDHQLQTNETGYRRQIEELTALLQESEADRAARLSQVEELAIQLQESEADRAARLSQTEEFAALLKESEADRAARLSQIEDLTKQFQESEADRAARSRKIEDLTVFLQESEADRAARLDMIEALTVLLQTNDATGIPPTDASLSPAGAHQS